MLVNCKPGCEGKKGTTNVLLDVETNQAVCEFCEAVVNISSFTKNSMKQNGDILRKDTRKPFQFECKTCNELVMTCVQGNKLVGQSCDSREDCSFDVSKFTLHAMKNIVKVVSKSEEGNE